VKKRILPSMFAFVALHAGALFGQDVTGTWQGTIHTTRDIREVISISKDGDTLKAVLFSIDLDPGQNFPSPPVILQRNSIKIQFPGIGGEYNGPLSADGNSIVGSFFQGSRMSGLNLSRATVDTAWEIPSRPPPRKPMAADANPSFEVASIKPSPADARGGGSGVSPSGRFTTRNTSVRDLMILGYGIHPRQIEGGPAWFENDRFDIVAQPDTEGTPGKQQVMIMVQKLLTDRFSLRFHRDKKDISAYAITVGKEGSKLTPSTGDPNGLPAFKMEGVGHLSARNMNVEEFSEGLQGNIVDRPVLDRTGLSGRFDFTLNWTPDEFQFARLGIKIPPPDNSPTLPDLFTAFQNQLGLKLESTKALVEVLVIDRVEKPSGN